MEDTGFTVSPETMEKLLRSVPDGPIKNAEDILIPKPWSRSQIFGTPKRPDSRRGPKSQKEWAKEIRNIWGQLEDEEKLSKSWLAMLTPVQNLAARKYGGRTVGQGLALQELLKKSLLKVQEYDMEYQTREIIKRFPNMDMNDIADKVGMERSYMSRTYTRKAVSLLTKAFQVIINNPK